MAPHHGSPSANPDRLADWASPDAVIVYELVEDRLVRSDHEAGTSVTIAKYLSGFQAFDQGGSVSLQLSFSYRRFANFCRTRASPSRPASWTTAPRERFRRSWPKGGRACGTA